MSCHCKFPWVQSTAKRGTNSLGRVTKKGFVPTAVYTLLRNHADGPKATAARMQRTAVTKTATQLNYCTQNYVQHTATLSPTDQAHLLKLLHYQP